MATSSSVLVTVVLRLVAAPFLIRYIGIGGFGVFSLFVSITAVGGIVDAGIAPVVIRLIGRSRHSQKRLKRSFSTVLLFGGGVTLICAGAGALLALALHLVHPDRISADLTLSLFVFEVALGMAWAVMMQIALSVLRGLHRFSGAALYDSLFLFVTQVAAIYAAFRTHGVQDAIVASLFAAFGCVFFAWSHLVVRMGFGGLRAISIRNLRRHLGGFAAISLGRALVLFAGQRADRILVAVFLDFKTLGIYSAAAAAANVFLALGSKAVSVLLPFAVERRSDIVWIGEVLRGLTRKISWVAACFAAVSCVLAPIWMRMWLGQAIAADALWPFAVLVWVAAGALPGGPANNLALATGKVGLLAAIQALENTIAILLMVGLGFFWGFAGILAAKVALMPVSFVLRTYLANQLLLCRNPFLIADTLPPLLLAGPSLGTLLLIGV